MKNSTYHLIQSHKARRMQLLARAACYRPAIAARLYSSLLRTAVALAKTEREIRNHVINA